MKNIEKDTTLKKVLMYLLAKPVDLVLSREAKTIDFFFFLMLKVRKSQKQFLNICVFFNSITLMSFSFTPYRLHSFEKRERNSGLLFSNIKLNRV